MSELIRVVLADHNALVLAGLRSLCEAEPDLRVVATASDGEALCQAVERFRPDVAVVETRLPRLDGLSCLRHIGAVCPRTKVLMLTDEADSQTLHALIRAGADGLLLKADPPAQTIQGLREVVAGALVLPAAARRWLAGGALAGRRDPLSLRESEVLALVAQGLSNRQVAEKLFVSENTVKFHLQNVFQRLEVANRTQASRWYLRNHAPDATEIPARLRVLVVEDEALVAEEIRDRLEHLNIEVVSLADTGEQAIRLVEETRPDLVLMDIRLKGELDGIQAAARIRERSEVPILYLTAHSDASTVDRAMEGAPFGYILKPFQEKDLRIAIASALSRARSEQVLKERNAIYASMLASIADAVVAVDTFGCVSFINAAAEAISGWSRDETMGRPVEEVVRMVDERTREEIELPVSRALREGCAEGGTHDAMVLGRRGETIPVGSSSAPVLDARGQLIGAVMVMRDQRERRRLQEALRSAEGMLARTQTTAERGRAETVPLAEDGSRVALSETLDRRSSPAPRRRV